MVLRAPSAFESIINTTLDAFGLLSSESKNGGTSLEIRQIEGANRRSIVLRERAMPYQEPSWSVVQKTKKTTYPGNPIATQQVLNPDFENTTFEGMWKDRFLKGAIMVDGDDTVVASAEDAQRLFEGLALAGKLLRVQWLSYIRVGLLVRLDCKPQTSRDVKWEMEFEWQGREEQKGRRVAPSLETPSPDDLLNLFNTITDVVAMAPGVIASFNAVFVSAIADVGARVRSVVNLLRVAESILSLPAQIVGAIEAEVRALVRQVQELTRQLSDRWNSTVMGSGASQALSTPTEDDALGTQTSALASQASYAAWSRSLSLSLGQLAFATQRAYQGVVDRVQPTTLRVVTVAEGETLYSLAERLYGSPDFANFLAVTNGLTSATVPPGFQLRAPGRPFSAIGPQEMSGGKQSGAPGSL